MDTIFLVEDDMNIRRLTGMHLQLAGSGATGRRGHPLYTWRRVRKTEARGLKEEK